MSSVQLVVHYSDEKAVESVKNAISGCHFHSRKWGKTRTVFNIRDPLGNEILLLRSVCQKITKVCTGVMVEGPTSSNLSGENLDGQSEIEVGSLVWDKQHLKFIPTEIIGNGFRFGQDHFNVAGATFGYDQLADNFNNGMARFVFIDISNEEDTFHVFIPVKTVMKFNRFVYSIPITYTELPKFLGIMSSKLIKTYFMRVETKRYPIFTNGLDFEEDYLLHYMRCQSLLVYIGREFVELFKKTIQERDGFNKYCFIDTLCKHLKTETFADAIAIFTSIIQEEPSTCFLPNTGYKLVKSIEIIEENNIQFNLPQMVEDSRFFREYGVDDLLKVKLNGNFKALFDGLTCCGENYCLVFGSLGQIMSGSIYFRKVRSSDTIASIFSKFGCFEVLESPSKKLLGMALNFFSSIPTVDLKAEDYLTIEDHIAEDGTLLSDGIGRISTSLASEVAKKLNLDHVPTAFQVQFRGFKVSIPSLTVTHRLGSFDSM